MNHPDKKPGDEEAEWLFKEATAAYEVLSDAEQRKKYDAGELDVDEMLANMGTGMKAMLALFSKLSGLSMSMPLSEEVMTSVSEGGFDVTPLTASTPVSAKVKKQQADYYSFECSADVARAGGFVVRVASKNGSKFKLVLVDGKAVRVVVDAEPPVGQEGNEEITGAKARNVTVAHLFINAHPHLRFAPTNPRQIEMFQDSDGLTEDAAGVATAKRYVFAVQGDNFFAATPYTICVVPGAASSSTLVDIARIEQQLIEERNDLLPFRAEFAEAQRRFELAQQRYETEAARYLERQNARGVKYEAYFAECLDKAPLVVEDKKKGRRRK